MIHPPVGDPIKETATESYSMNKWFGATCDRYGHLITLGAGLTSGTNPLFAVPRVEPIELVPPVAQSTQEDLKETALRDATPNSRAEVAHPTNRCPKRRDSHETG
jgi:hypothetical protein